MAELPWLPFEWDVNHDHIFTVSDVVLWLRQTFFVPGDWAIWFVLTYFPELGRFLELKTSDYGSVISALIAMPCWIVFVVSIMTVSHYVAAADRTFTRALGGGARNVLIAFRANRRRFAAWLRRRSGSSATGLAAIDEFGLTNAELRVLGAHAHLRPPATLSLADLVRATGVPRTQVASILSRLQDLRLIASQGGPDEGSCGYVLTEPGQEIAAYQRLSVRHSNR